MRRKYNSVVWLPATNPTRVCIRPILSPRFAQFTTSRGKHNNRQSQEHPLLLQPQVLCTSTWVCYYCSSHAIFHNEGGQIASGGSQLGWARLVSSRRGNRKCANQLLLKSILWISWHLMFDIIWSPLPYAVSTEQVAQLRIYPPPPSTVLKKLTKTKMEGHLLL